MEGSSTQKKTRRGKRKKKIPNHEKPPLTLREISEQGRNFNNALRRQKRKNSGMRNVKAHEQRSRKRLRKRLAREGKVYTYIDPATRVRQGPSDSRQSPKYPEFLVGVPVSNIYTNDLLIQTVQYFHELVFDNCCGEISIAWEDNSQKIDGFKVYGYYVFDQMNQNHVIRLNKSTVRTKKCMYGTVAHELVHAVVKTKYNVDDEHGNRFVQECARFLKHDENLDVYGMFRYRTEKEYEQSDTDEDYEYDGDGKDEEWDEIADDDVSE